MLIALYTFPCRSTAAEQQPPQFSRIRSYGMPGGNVEFDDLYFRDESSLVQKLMDPEQDLRMEGMESEQLKAVLEARLSAADLMFQPSGEDLPAALSPASGQPEGNPAGLTSGGIPFSTFCTFEQIVTQTRKVISASLLQLQLQFILTLVSLGGIIALVYPFILGMHIFFS